mgnify:CR=1 FL=1
MGQQVPQGDPPFRYAQLPISEDWDLCHPGHEAAKVIIKSNQIFFDKLYRSDACNHLGHGMDPEQVIGGHFGISVPDGFSMIIGNGFCIPVDCHGNNRGKIAPLHRLLHSSVHFLLGWKYFRGFWFAPMPVLVFGRSLYV